MKALLATLLLLASALSGCSEGESDADGDSISDVEEERGWPIVVDLVGRRVGRDVTSDPERLDSDGDGLTDAQEVTFPGGLDPRSPDTDGDGLTDCQELVDSDRARCEDPGREGPGDGGTRTSPNNADSEPGGRYHHRWGAYIDETGTIERATWGDGIPDGEELAGYAVTVMGSTRQVRTDPTKADTDNDLLDDGEERHRYGTDPTQADTDGDGCIDGMDPIPDRHEGYRLGLDRFEAAAHLPQGTRVQLLVQDFLSHAVPANGTFEARPGAATDLRPLDPPAYGKGRACPVETYPGWMPVQVLAQAGGPEARPLDLYSTTPGLRDHYDGAGVATFYWHPASHRFSWTADGGFAVAAPLALSGADGTLRLDPHVADAFKP